MPRKDKTGPQGMGPKTGKGQGACGTGRKGCGSQKGLCQGKGMGRKSGQGQGMGQRPNKGAERW